MKKTVYILGAGSVGGFIANSIDEFQIPIEIGGFFDDDWTKVGKDFHGYKVFGTSADLLALPRGTAVVIGIAFPSLKQHLVQLLCDRNSFEYPSLIHNRAWHSSKIDIGNGVIIYPGCSINYGCAIDSFVVINMNCAIGHNCSIGKYSSLSPGVNLGGYTSVGELCEIGIGAASRQSTKIGDSVVVGGQSMVLGEVPSNSKVKGVPGRFYL